MYPDTTNNAMHGVRKITLARLTSTCSYERSEYNPTSLETQYNRHCTKYVEVGE